MAELCLVRLLVMKRRVMTLAMLVVSVCVVHAAATISAAIENYVTSEAKKSKDGKFWVEFSINVFGGSYDHPYFTNAKTPAVLIKIHDERRFDLGGGKYFCSVEMRGADGEPILADFFLAGKSGNIVAVGYSIQRIKDQSFYKWKQENGIWKKIPIS